MNYPTLTLSRASFLMLFVLISTGMPQPATASPCANWLGSNFWKSASLSDVDRCLVTSALTSRTESGLTLLHLAAIASETPAIITALIDAGADLNARTESGATPLHAAANNSETPAIITVLIDAGADVNARTKDGKRPIDYARENEALAGSDAYWQLNDASYNN